MQQINIAIMSYWRQYQEEKINKRIKKLMKQMPPDMKYIILSGV